jgi:hypothetical protein
MNYVWDLTIRAERLGLSKKNLRFFMPEVFSPYMELSHVFINITEPEPDVPVNPYYRFYDIFKDLFDPNYLEDEACRNAIMDLVFHLLVDLDRMQGMNKHEFYVRFILKDIERGLFGPRLAQAIHWFDRDERYMIAENVYGFYQTGEMIYFLADTLKKVFNEVVIYANYEMKDELLFFINTQRTEINEAKYEAIKELFLPIRFRTEVYWADHFGIIGNDEAMKVGRIAIY